MGKYPVVFGEIGASQEWRTPGFVSFSRLEISKSRPFTVLGLRGRNRNQKESSMITRLLCTSSVRNVPQFRTQTKSMFLIPLSHLNIATSLQRER